jgi:hypothetical protein
MEEPERPRLCAECPLVPPGVTAELTGAEVETMETLRRFRFAVDSPEAAAHFANSTRIHTEAVETTNPQVDVGDVASMLVDANGMGAEALATAIRECPGPVRSRLQRIVGSKGVCGCMSDLR